MVPFVLQKGWYSVEIIDPLSADILDLDIISDRFEPSVPTFVDLVWGFFTGNCAIRWARITYFSYMRH